MQRLGDEDGGQLVALVNQHRNLGFLSSESEIIRGVHVRLSLC